MQMYSQYKSPLGYQTNDNGIDSYGVDHSNFSLRDELAYQLARQQRENQIIQNFHNQGITKDYPQMDNSFWGTSPDNNYGFGNSQISSNIENIQRTNVPNDNTINSSQNKDLGYDNLSPNAQDEINTQKKLYSLKQVGNTANLILDTIKYTGENLGELAADAQIAYQHYNKMNDVGKKLVEKYGTGQADGIDNYYHALLQCKLAQISPTSRDWGLRMGYGKEIYDYHKKKDHMPMQTIIADSRKDLKNNLYGSNIGYYNQYKNCEDMLDELRTENMRKENIR